LFSFFISSKDFFELICFIERTLFLDKTHILFYNNVYKPSNFIFGMAKYRHDEVRGGCDKVGRTLARKKGVHAHNGHPIPMQQEVSDDVFRNGGYHFLGRMQVFCTDFPHLRRGFLVKEDDDAFTFTKTLGLRFVRQGNGWSLSSSSLEAIGEESLPIVPSDTGTYATAQRIWRSYGFS
jgi:hypothetical protein